MSKQKCCEQRMQEAHEPVSTTVGHTWRHACFSKKKKKKNLATRHWLATCQCSALSLPILINSKQITRWRVQCNFRSSLSPIRNPPWRLLCPPAHSQHAASNQGSGRCMHRSRRCRMLARQRQRALPSGGAPATVLARPRAACPRCASRWGPTGPSGSPAPLLPRGSTAAFRETLDLILSDLGRSRSRCGGSRRRS